MKNEEPQGETSSRALLAASIMEDQPVKELSAASKGSEQQKTTKKPKLSSKKPKLKEGVTYEDVFQWYEHSQSSCMYVCGVWCVVCGVWCVVCGVCAKYLVAGHFPGYRYNLSELQDFAREHKIKVSGKKKELINRILISFLRGDKENNKVKKPSKKQSPEQTAITSGCPLST